MDANNRFADFVLFEKLSQTPLATTFRAGHVFGSLIDRHVLLLRFDDPKLDHEAFWQLVSDREPLLQSLRDPHLGNATDFGRAGTTAFLGYSYLPGATLARFLEAVRTRGFPVSADQALFIIERVALALTAAHGLTHRGRPVLHGFLVPELIHLSSEGEIRLLGIEAAPGLRSQLLNRAEYSSYLAPEVRAGLPPAETDDVYSLGAVLMTLLTGEPVPDGDQEAIGKSIDRAHSADGEVLPPAIRKLLRSSLAPASDRIANAVAWQQTVGKLILEGDYNPTTFNLSFLLHTLFRSEIEAELPKLAEERAIRLTLAQEPPRIEETPAVEPTSASSRTRLTFLLGFLASFVGALLLIAGFFLLRGGLRASTAAIETPAQLVASDPRPDSSSIEIPQEYDQDQFQAQSAEEAPPAADAPKPEDDARLADTEAEAQESEGRSRPDAATEIRRYQQELAELRRQIADAKQRPQDTEVERRQPAGASRRTDANESSVLEPLSPVATEQMATAEAELPEVTEDADSPTALDLDSPSQDVPENLVAGREPEAAPELEGPSTSTGGAAEPPPAGELGTETTLEAAETAAANTVPPTPAIASTPLVEPPGFRSCPRPVYPAAARRFRRAATARVRVLVGEDGQVLEAVIDGPELGFGFDQAALSAAERSLWSPATRNGEPVEAWTELTLEFKP